MSPRPNGYSMIHAVGDVSTCKDSETSGFSKTMSDGQRISVSCVRAVQDLSCDHSQHGANLRKRCPKSCNVCVADNLDKLVPLGFQHAWWNVPRMCEDMFTVLGDKTKSVCGATIPTYVNASDTIAAKYGVTATIDCRGGPNPGDNLSEDYVVNRLCSQICMMDRSKGDVV